jgi:hypothetical protein
MAASTDKTIWTLGLVGAFAFLVWKLWPALKKFLNDAGGGSGGGGSVGQAASASPYPFFEPSQGSNGGGLSGSANLGGGGGGNGGPPVGGSSNPISALGNAINNLFSDAVNAEDTLADQSQLEVDSAQAAEPVLDQIPTESIQNWTNFDSYTPDDPNAPWNSGLDTGVDTTSPDLSDEGIGVTDDSGGGGGGGGGDGDDEGY